MTDFIYNDNGTSKNALSAQDQLSPLKSQALQIQTRRNIGIPAGFALLDDNNNHDYQLEYYNQYYCAQTVAGTRFSLPPVNDDNGSINNGASITVTCAQDATGSITYYPVEIYDYNFNNLVAVVIPGDTIEIRAVGFTVSPTTGWQPYRLSDLARSPVYALTADLNLDSSYSGICFTTDNLADYKILIDDSTIFPIGGYFTAYRDTGNIIVIQVDGAQMLNGQTSTNFKLDKRYQSVLIKKVGVNDYRTSYPVYQGGSGISVNDNGNNTFNIDLNTTIPTANLVSPGSISSTNATGVSVATNSGRGVNFGGFATLNFRALFTPTAGTGALTFQAPFMSGTFAIPGNVDGVAVLSKVSGSTGNDGNVSFFQCGAGTQNISIPWIVTAGTGSQYQMLISVMYQLF